MKPILQSTKNVMELKLEWKRKRLMIGCVHHRESQVMIVKRPQTEDKKMLYWYFQQNILYPPPIKSPTIKDEFKYSDYM